MSKLVVELRIGDYAKWRSVFDKNKSLRDAAGFKNLRIYRNADDVNDVVLLGETSDMRKLRKALTAPQLRAAMQEAGVVGQPMVHIIR
jgi:hypothetical protein